MRLRPVPTAKLCECGCGVELTQKYSNYVPRFIKGHYGRIKTPEHMRKVAEKNIERKGWHHSEEARKKMSETRKGRVAYIPSEETKRKISETLKGHEGWTKGIPKTEEMKQRISDTVKLRHKEGAYINSYSHKNSKIELSLIPYLEPLGYISTSIEKFYVRAKGGKTRIPDYVNRQDHKIIEVFGIYWHRDRVLYEGQKHETTEEVIAWYKKQGWDCMIIWEDEVSAFKEKPWFA
jgi:G:T-mismatch repair DNA endonuclease (very short patch repair protein)